MITLKLNPYSDLEKHALETALLTAVSTLQEKHCGVQMCQKCTYRHVCYDLKKALDYAGEETRRNETQNHD